MVFRDKDKEVLKNNGYTALSKITVSGTNIVLTEADSLVDWDYEDYRYVPENGFIGQFVERIFDGTLKDVPENVVLENAEINMQLGIVNAVDGKTTWYDYGNFLITSLGEKDTSGQRTFESCDYTKKFNTLYESQIYYPCTALELANNVCSQADVELSANGKAYIYCVPEEGLSAGTYHFIVIDGDTTTYYAFTTTSDLKLLDTIMYRTYDKKLIVKNINSDYTITRTELTYTNPTTEPSTTELNGSLVNYNDFTNNDFVITDNQFDTDATLRDVIKCISQLGYTWARVGCDNKVHLDFTPNTTLTVDTYDTITTDEYYECDKQDLYYGPVNKVLVGMSDVDGENIYKTSSDYTEDTECCLDILDNNLTNTAERRAIALNGCERLFGLKYIPLTTQTIGHPWLEGDELIKLTNLKEQDLYTYPFDRKVSYTGVLKGEISSTADTSLEREYEYSSGDLETALKLTRITVDKANQTITSMAEEINTNSSKITTAQQDISTISLSVEELQTDSTSTIKRVTKLEETVDGISLTKTVSGGGNLIKNSVGYFGNEYWALPDSEDSSSITKYDSLDVKNNSISGCALYLQKETVQQVIDNIKTGDYWISFSYKKLAENATCKVIINDTEIVLSEYNSWKDISQAVKITTESITIKLVSNYANSCLITDLMFTAGTEEVTWRQNSNETYTDNVKIGKGIQITATGSDTMLEAVAEGIQIKNSSNSEVTSTFNKYGTTTNQLEVKGSATIENSLVIKKVGDQIWFSTID